MAQLKVDPGRWEIQKAPGSYNDWVWTGLTLGKLMALRGVLLQLGSNSAILNDLFICLDRAVKAGEAEMTAKETP